PPEGFIAEAEREELDFFAITDHNTWSYPAFAHSEHVLVIPGIEVTMPYGHFNVFSVDATEPDWVSTLPDPGPVMRDDQAGAAVDLVETIARQRLPASINHPLLFPWEWVDPAAPLTAFRYLEVWNDPTWPENRLANPAALAMWTRWLQAGLRITALGGSDFHNPEKTVRGDGVTVDGHRVGMPRSYVNATANTREAILSAADAGRVYVTMGPRLELAVETESGVAEIGDEVPAGDGAMVVHARCHGGQGSLDLRLVADGNTVATSAGTNPGIEHRWTGPRPSWLRVEVVQVDEVIAFTNPIYFGSPAESPDADYGTFTDVSAAFEILQQWNETNQAPQEEEDQWPTNA
ncbi:MAG: CehA/McbA family metallohydrolase, partial [Acidimicrobiia bacterium]|nr:CehA/McbA family metallohydrolase [Acidimicrobiia bacterium]